MMLAGVTGKSCPSDDELEGIITGVIEPSSSPPPPGGAGGGIDRSTGLGVSPGTSVSGGPCTTGACPVDAVCRLDERVTAPWRSGVELALMLERGIRRGRFAPCVVAGIWDPSCMLLPLFPLGCPERMRLIGSLPAGAAWPSILGEGGRFVPVKPMGYPPAAAT
jgi:hypothetical protein